MIQAGYDTRICVHQLSHVIIACVDYVQLASLWSWHDSCVQQDQISLLYPFTARHRGKYTLYYEASITRTPLKNSQPASSMSDRRASYWAGFTQRLRIEVQWCSTYFWCVVSMLFNSTRSKVKWVQGSALPRCNQVPIRGAKEKLIF